jgi:hypothetical protein
MNVTWVLGVCQLLIHGVVGMVLSFPEMKMACPFDELHRSTGQCSHKCPRYIFFAEEMIKGLFDRAVSHHSF